jgi:hypothetical protein
MNRTIQTEKKTIEIKSINNADHIGKSSNINTKVNAILTNRKMVQMKTIDQTDNSLRAISSELGLSFND